MIDFVNITNFQRTTAELEEFLLFAIVVAGKNSKIQATKLAIYLSDKSLTPFETIRKQIENASVYKSLLACRMGQYQRIVRAFTYLATRDINLHSCSVGDLLAYPGIGNKTARFFLLHSREDQNYAVLDTHVLRWLNTQGVKAPKVTPGNRERYAELESAFLRLSAEHNCTPAELDLKIWTEYSKHTSQTPNTQLI